MRRGVGRPAARSEREIGCGEREKNMWFCARGIALGFGLGAATVDFLSFLARLGVYFSLNYSSHRGGMKVRLVGGLAEIILFLKFYEILFLFRGKLRAE